MRCKVSREHSLMIHFPPLFWEYEGIKQIFPIKSIIIHFIFLCGKIQYTFSTLCFVVLIALTNSAHSHTQNTVSLYL